MLFNFHFLRIHGEKFECYVRSSCKDIYMCLQAMSDHSGNCGPTSRSSFDSSSNTYQSSDRHLCTIRIGSTIHPLTIFHSESLSPCVCSHRLIHGQIA